MQFPSWELRSLSWALVITPPNNGLADGAPVTPKSKARPNKNITGTYIAELPNLYVFYFLAAQQASRSERDPAKFLNISEFLFFICFLNSNVKEKPKPRTILKTIIFLCQEVFDYSIPNIYNKFYFWRQQQNMSFFA